MLNDTEYNNPMLPWHGLEKFSKTTQIDEEDLEIFYFEAGENHPPSIMMIHGLGDEADTWRHVFTPLSNRYHVIALDLPGFGRSVKPDVKYTPPFMTKVIIGLMERTGIETGILMGSSLGGILSHSLALSHPERVSGLILVDGALLQPEPMGDWSLRLMQIPLLGEWLYSRLRKDPDAAFNSLRNVYHDLDSLPESDRDFLFTRVNKRVWSDGQRRAYFSTLRNLTPWIMDMQSKVPDQLSHLSIPTLVLRGEHDALFPEENAQGIMRVQPNAQMKIIEEAGHLPHQEKPEAFLDAVLLWLTNTFKE
jgi:pimeloyl-ACP methyl ester carboxylesterase